MKYRILLCAAALCFASVARAQNACPQPTLALCQDTNWLKTPCGQPQTLAGSTCQQLVQAEYQARTANLPLGSHRVPGNTTAVAPARHQDQQHFNYNVSGGTGVFGGIAQKTQIGGAMEPLPPGAAPAPGTPQYTYLGVTSTKNLWSADGARVKSCNEYVYEGFYDYELFEDQAALHGTDYRAIFNLAFGPAPYGIASRMLRDRASETIPTQMTWPAASYPDVGAPNLLPKNAFYAGYEKLLAKGFVLNDPALDTALHGGFESWYAQDWTWHAGMSASLAGTPDDVLSFLEDKKTAFSEKVAIRNALWDKVQAEPPASCPPGSWFCLKDGELDLSYADMDLRDMLHDAQAQGCVNASATTACDWSPKMFYDALQSFFDHQREVARTRCLDATGDDFTTARTNATSVGCIQNDMTVKPSYMRWYIDRALAAQATLAYPIDPVTGKPHLGDSVADSWTVGDPDWFQAQFGYDASWKIDNFVNSLMTSRQTCDAHIVTTAGASDTTTILGTAQPIFTARADAYTSDTGANLKLLVTVLGVEQLNYQKLNQATKFTYTKDWTYSDEWSRDSGLTILGVGVTLTAGFSASAGVDLVVVGVGIKGEVNLVKLNVPLDTNLKLSMTPTRAVFAQLVATGKLSLRSLDGSLVGYIDWPYPISDSEESLFSWDGFVVPDEVLFSINRSSVNMATVKAQLDPVVIR